MVESSGQANFTELDGGEQDVFGKATAVQVLGGTQVIESGGIASENTVLGGRKLYLPVGRTLAHWCWSASRMSLARPRTLRLGDDHRPFDIRRTRSRIDVARYDREFRQQSRRPTKPAALPCPPYVPFSLDSKSWGVGRVTIFTGGTQVVESFGGVTSTTISGG